MTAAPSPSATRAWYALDPASAAQRLGSDLARGLSDAEARRRIAQHGPNTLRESQGRGRVAIAVAQFTDFMILLLIGAAIASGIIGDMADTAVILGIVIVNAAVGFAQEFQAERAMAALRRLAAPGALVLREGTSRTMAADWIVPGDVVLLEAGSAVPADLRLVEAAGLTVGEAALTGESVPVAKQTAAIDGSGLPIAERGNMAFKGTVVLAGRGRGLVVATGMATELGGVAGMLEGAGQTRTPLQLRLAAFGRQISLAAVAICVVIFVTGVVRGEPPLLMLMTALSLGVAAIPEAMPAVVTVLLALGARRMAREHALIRRLPAVETLGSVTTICTDKTGTLTRNELRAVEIHAGRRRQAAGAIDRRAEPERTLLLALALCNDVAAAEDAAGNAAGVRGDPTEVALWRLASGFGVDKAAEQRAAPRILELPFDSGRKRMTTLHRRGRGFVAYVKGAPEAVIGRCTGMATSAGIVPLDPAAMSASADAMADDGLRVLAVACRAFDTLPDARSEDAIEQRLTLLGLVGLLDPPRDEARAAVATCRAAGITVVMITGDHPLTARAIARQIGLMGEADAVLTGRDLQTLTDEQLLQRVADIRVYARLDPAQKIRIVAALQARGEVVAMTGDGVNDAPALARAEIGIAMGRIGTDVARESASLVLLDDNFATIVTAVREGRRIYANIRRFVRFVVSCNSAEIWTIFLAPFLGMPVPLLPIQILWMNLVTDGLPGLALAAEPAERGIMRLPPRPKQEGLFAGGMLWQVVWMGLLMAAATLTAQAFALQSGRDHWRTMAFTVLTLAQMWQVLAIRSDQVSLLRQGLFSNLPLLGAVLLTFTLQLALIYVPPLSAIFHTAPLTGGELAACIALSSIVFFAIEATKWVARRGAAGR